MFYGYSWDRWLGLFEYCGIVSILFTASIILSCLLTNKTLHKEKKISRTKKAKSKSWFIDVA